MPPFTLNQDAHTVTLATDELELAFSRDDGGLRSLRRSVGPNVLGHGAPQPGVDVQVGAAGAWLAGRVFVRYLSHHAEVRDDDSVELIIVIGIGSLIIHDRYRITGTLIARRISVVNVSEDAVQLQRVRLSLPWVCIGSPETCQFEAPGNSLRSHVPLLAVAATQQATTQRNILAPETRAALTFEPAPTYAPGLLAVHNPHMREALLCWYHSDVEPAHPLIEGNDHALTLTHELELADWLSDEITLSGGTQYILLLPQPWDDARAAFRNALAVHTRAPEQRAAWVREGALYEVHAAEFGGFAGLAARLDWLHELGVTTLCLLPIWDFHNRTGRLWDGNWHDTGDPYAVCDFELLDATLGSADDLRALTRAVHARGMRVLVDLPLFGCARNSRYLDEQPDWFCHDESGQLATVGGHEDLACFDWSSRTLQAYIVAQASEQARCYDFDGYRIVPDRIVVPNWERRPAAHASSGAMNVLRVVARVRQVLQEWKPDAAILSPLSGPAGAATADIIFGELAHQQFFSAMLRRTSPQEFGTWLADAAAIAPTDCPRVCFVESHHTRLRAPLADGLRGSPLSRVWLASVVLCGYVPLIRAGQAWSDESFIKRLLRARAQMPALHSGQVAFNAVQSSSADVFSVLWQADGQLLLGVLNIGPHKHIATFTLPVAALNLTEGCYTLHEEIDDLAWEEAGQRAWTRAELAALSLTLDPFGTYFFRVQPGQTCSDVPCSAVQLR